jgi:hypothetical protein
MKTLIIILFGVFLILFTSCKDEQLCCFKTYASIYKLNDTSYINFLPVCSVGTCFPDNTFNPSPIKMHNGFYLENGGFSMFGGNTTLLNIRIKDYVKLNINFSYDSLRKNVLTDNPFKEFYKDERFFLGDDVINLNLDTAKLNRIIDAGEMAKYFTKVK